MDHRTTLTLHRLDQLNPQPPRWIIPQLIPAGRLSLIVAPSGAGLTQLGLLLAASISQPVLDPRRLNTPRKPSRPSPDAFLALTAALQAQPQRQATLPASRNNPPVGYAAEPQETRTCPSHAPRLSSVPEPLPSADDTPDPLPHPHPSSFQNSSFILHNSDDDDPGPSALLLPGPDSADILVPRLKALGADGPGILLLSEILEREEHSEFRHRRRFDPLQHHGQLNSLLAENPSLRLIVIDHAERLFCASNHPARPQITRALEQLEQLAQKYHIAIVLLCSIPSHSPHPFRSTTLSTLHTACRVVHLLAQDPDHPGSRLLFCLKNTVSATTATHRLDSTQPPGPFFAFLQPPDPQLATLAYPQYLHHLKHRTHTATLPASRNNPPVGYAAEPQETRTCPSHAPRLSSVPEPLPSADDTPDPLPHPHPSSFHHSSFIIHNSPSRGPQPFALQEACT